MLKKDFDGLRVMVLVKPPNEYYKRSKGHLQTDVLSLQWTIDGYRLYLYRDDAKSYYKNVTIVFKDETKNKIIHRMIDKLNTDF